VPRVLSAEPGIDDIKEEEEEGDDDDDKEEDETGVIEVETGATVKKKKGGTHNPRWRSLQDECLIEASKPVNIDPITGANHPSLAPKGLAMIWPNMAQPTAHLTYHIGGGCQPRG
jgi:hypothetical protein